MCLNFSPSSQMFFDSGGPHTLPKSEDLFFFLILKRVFLLFSSQASHSRGPLSLIGSLVSSSVLWDPCSVVDAVNTRTSPETCGPSWAHWTGA